jgi:BirA family biotin operon repressor/biotin-[acetyl-CoA-carboxylase] ligase
VNEVAQLRRSSAIDQLLADNWLAKVEWFSEIDSTNNYMKRSVGQVSIQALPQLAVADRQTAGRGRGQNSWWSGDGCLMFSLAWRPRPSCQEQPSDIPMRMSQLPLVVGISIADALTDLIDGQAAIKVKWPNDVYVGDRKLGGILIENVVGLSEPFWIIGVGVNVLVDFDNSPEPIRSKATSLHRACTMPVRGNLCIEYALISILSKLRTSLDDWQEDSDFLHKLWPAYCMLTDRWIEVQQNGQCLQGICCGITQDGALILRDKRGHDFHLLTGVVQSW